MTLVLTGKRHCVKTSGYNKRSSENLYFKFSDDLLLICIKLFAGFHTLPLADHEFQNGGLDRDHDEAVF